MSGYYGDTIPIADYRGKQYQPSNGTEGSCFHEEWCCKCKHDKAMNGTVAWDAAGPDDYCPTLGESFQGEGTEAWIFGEDGWPKCTKFISVDDPDTARDEHTIDMFGEQA
jgi:hypothetical protein